MVAIMTEDSASSSDDISQGGVNNGATSSQEPEIWVKVNGKIELNKNIQRAIDSKDVNWAEAFGIKSRREFDIPGRSADMIRRIFYPTRVSTSLTVRLGLAAVSAIESLLFTLSTERYLDLDEDASIFQEAIYARDIDRIQLLLASGAKPSIELPGPPQSHSPLEDISDLDIEVTPEPDFREVYSVFDLHRLAQSCPLRYEEWGGERRGDTWWPWARKVQADSSGTLTLFLPGDDEIKTWDAVHIHVPRYCGPTIMVTETLTHLGNI
ncbi:hypothetical protein K491DRAFT_109588 [Lophiostoma macrostomum CBS 122681]|uniref:Uncharacterized protein n=1 Tax=Lophiostoma macrostomum CBS 122681 TaxID=1314788 RepID=A0A6A6TLK7_9PLEO|nr:hypothetical protein K491DRAFT_109588 [Lophiostoma macrostomum CBS 122681]